MSSLPEVSHRFPAWHRLWVPKLERHTQSCGACHASSVVTVTLSHCIESNASGARLGPLTVHRLPLSAGCVQTLLRFRMGCHNLPWDLGRRQGIPRLHRVCALCTGDNPGDEQHVIFECPGLQDIRDKHQGLFGEHAATMLQFMWQDDIHGVAIFIQACLDRCYAGPDPQGGRASDQP